MNISISAPEPAQLSEHLEKSVWKQVNRLHLRKILSEFAHENIIVPQVKSENTIWSVYTLHTENGKNEYFFNAQILALNHWLIDPNSIKKLTNGDAAPLDCLQFIVEVKENLDIPDSSFPEYIEEVSSTLNASAYTYFNGKPTSEDLVNSDYQKIEGTMTGHPRFIANNGRLGFEAEDYINFAPETAKPFSLLWIAGHKQIAQFTGNPTLTYNKVMAQELGKDLFKQFCKVIELKGFNADDYYFLPVHPWQWFNKLTNIFSSDIANNQLICLGYSKDKYLPQQSIRTFYNVSKSKKFYVKTSLGILNMGYIRGLSPKFMKTNPGINEWIFGLVNQDPYLKENGFCILQEVASVSFAHKYYEKAIAKKSPYKEMLACLWRESPISKIKPGQQIMTMAALIHVDNNGTALLPKIIQASGLNTKTWLEHYLNCYLTPLLHCFYKWNMVFMPHGENLILVLENHTPVKAIMKDIGEEVSLLSPQYEVPDEAKRLIVEMEDKYWTLPLFTQLFDSFFRFVASVLIENERINQVDFWKTVAITILKYQKSHPEYKEKYKKYDLFTDSFSPDALNKLQLQNHKQLRNRANPFLGLPSVEGLTNPITSFKSTTV